jgi:3',5'-cyclic AMP phosphodiesterase CpdA
MSLDDIFSFIHLSDTHIPEKRDETVNGVQPYLKLENTINTITQLKIKPKFTIITGDLSQDGNLQGYKLLKQYTKKLEKENIPTLLTLGNHDNRENFRTIFHTEQVKGPYYYVTEKHGIRIIVLDSLYPNRHIGRFTGDQLDWLKEELNSDKIKPTIIAFHHPIYRPWLPILSKIFDSVQREKFYEIIKGCNVLAVLNGHLHHNLLTYVDGVLHSQAGSTYVELFYNDVEFWTKNTLNFNQCIIQDGAFYVNNLMLPYDGRILGKGSLQILIE